MVATHPLRVLGAVAAVLTAGLLGGCDDGTERSVEAYCEAVERLAADDPFEELAVASPEEMESAFEQLRAGAERIATSAPGEQRTSAEDYAAGVEALVDQLRAAGFDPRRVDPLAYRAATDDYTDAAGAVTRAADAVCA